MLKINVSVIDGDKRPIPDLKHTDFAIFEDGVKQQTECRFHDGSSMSFGLAFDVSDYEPLKVMARRAAAAGIRLTRYCGCENEISAAAEQISLIA